MPLRRRFEFLCLIKTAGIASTKYEHGFLPSCLLPAAIDRSQRPPVRRLLPSPSLPPPPAPDAGVLSDHETNKAGYGPIASCREREGASQLPLTYLLGRELL